MIETSNSEEKKKLTIKDIYKNINNIDDISLKLKLQDMQTVYIEYEKKIQNDYERKPVHRTVAL